MTSGSALLTGRARIAGVMGWPVAHSRSPALHGHWLRRYGIDGAYLPLAVPPERAAEAMRALSALGFAGANVTVPHKETAFQVADKLTGRARRIGAVNTLTVTPEGLLGDNTDGYGFLANLRQDCPGWDPKVGPAVVLGAGGAARAVAAALADGGTPEVWVVNRTAARAEALAETLGNPVRAAPWANIADLWKTARLLVNTTTLGMVGHPPLSLSLESLPPDCLVTDIVYAPLETDLLRRARDRGHPVVDGLGMLLHQAAPGFERWFGRAPQVDADLRTAVLESG